MTTGVFGVVVFFILAYLVVLLQVYGRRSCKFLVFFSTFGLPPPVPLSSGLGWLPISRLGFAHPGLFSVCGLLSGGSFFGRPSLFLPRPSGLNPVGGFPFFLVSFNCVLFV